MSRWCVARSDKQSNAGQTGDDDVKNGDTAQRMLVRGRRTRR